MQQPRLALEAGDHQATAGSIKVVDAVRDVLADALALGWHVAVVGTARNSRRPEVRVETTASVLISAHDDARVIDSVGNRSPGAREIDRRVNAIA